MIKIPEDFPKELIDRLKMITGDDFPSVCEAFSQKRVTTFRVNTLKSSREEITGILEKNAIIYESVPWFSDAFIVPQASARYLTETAMYIKGLIYVQSLSSMLPAIILDPQADEKVLDLTAAPGSKTTQMAAMMNNTGEIVANDTSSIRREKLKANLRIQGVTNTTVTNIPGQAFWNSYPEYFDRVLVDAPCSMEGRISFNLPKTYTTWTRNKVRELGHLQQWLLRSAISACKPGGTIVYSTCTLSPEENEAVVDWNLTKGKGAVALERIGMSHPKGISGFDSWNEKRFINTVALALRILPTQLMEGFFIAKFKKIASNIP